MEKPPGTLKREMAISQEAINEETRTVTLSFASEQPVNRWFGAEVLQIDAETVNFSRFENGLGCLLFNHQRDVVIGKILRAWTEDSKACAEVQFDTDTESERIWQKVKSGTLRGVSVGYSVDNWEEVAEGKKSTSGRVMGPAYIALRWTPLEISIVSVPADDSVGVGRQAEEGEEQTVSAQTKAQDNQVREGAPNPEITPPTDAEAVRQAERQRCAEITALCREFNMEPADYIEKGSSLEEAQRGILENLRQSNRGSATARITVGKEDSEKFRAAASDAILLREGIRIETPAAGSAELRSMRLRDLMIDCVEKSGANNARYMDDEELIRAAMTGTGAFPGILSAAANKSMSQGYEAAATTFEAWTGRGSNPDFKEATHYRLSEAGELVEVKGGGEFKSDEITGESAKKSVLTYGRKWGITRQAIINDDLAALTRIPARYAAASRRGINKLVYKRLAEASIFTAKNGNLGAPGAVPSVASIGAGRAAMRKQKNLRGKETLNIGPQFILIPSDLETATEQLLVSITDPAFQNSGVRNPFANKLEIICDAELDQYSTSAWYLAAQAGLVDTIEVTYLNGKETPVIESQISFDVLGMEWRIYIDYGVNLLDYRGLYKNEGK